MSGVAHPAPARHEVSLWTLLFGCSVAPIFWLGQTMLAYWVSAQVCYPGDHPTVTDAPGTLHTALAAFDAVAILAALAGGIVSWRCWRMTQEEKKGGAHRALHTGEGRARFMALWGILSSIGFLSAILFNLISSIMVPLCTP
jgi:hypothetical protein